MLEDAWDRLPEPHWAATAAMTAGERTLAEVVSHHLRNVEVHHVDLGAGYHASDWPALFVETELPKRLRDLSSRAAPADLLAWLIGRCDAPELGPW